MSERPVTSPGELVARTASDVWNTMLTVYYANSLPWRLLKSGGLFFFGFFLWAGSNVLLSYLSDFTVLHYTRSYGFVLIGYGPLHHLVVIPIYQRLRRQGTHLSLGSHLHLPNLSLVVFAVLVILLGMYPIGPVAIDFQSSLEGGSADITPDLVCVKSTTGEETTVHCHLTETQGFDRVEVRSGGETVTVDEDPPYEFTVRESELQTVAGDKQFRVDLVAEDGTLVRRYTRRLSMIEEGD